MKTEPMLAGAVEYVRDADVSDALDREIRDLLVSCFQKAEDSVFRTRRFFREPPRHRWMLRAESGRLAGHLAIHEKEVRVEGGAPVRIFGVAEVCVHPEFRGRGIVRRLLAGAHEWMPGRGMDFSVLFGKTEVYSSSGYVGVSNFLHHTADSTPERFQWERSTHCMVRALGTAIWPAGDVHLDGRAF